MINKIKRKIEIDNGDSRGPSMEVPSLCITNLPTPFIDELDINFQADVVEKSKETSSTETENSTDTSLSWGTLKVSGILSSSKDNTNSTNQTAKNQIHVSVSQQPPTEGLSKLKDIMASCIESIPINDSKK